MVFPLIATLIGLAGRIGAGAARVGGFLARGAQAAGQAAKNGFQAAKGYLGTNAGVIMGGVKDAAIGTAKILAPIGAMMGVQTLMDKKKEREEQDAMAKMQQSMPYGEY